MEATKAEVIDMFLEQEHIQYEKVTDLRVLMKACGGKRNPAGLVGFLIHPDIQDIDSPILFDMYEVVDFIQNFCFKQS